MAGPSQSGQSHMGKSAVPLLVVTFEEKAFQRISSFDQKPASGGTPAMARQEIRNVHRVSGRYGARPPMLRMSWLFSVSWMRACIAWITEPAPRKRQALKKACVKTWKKPAEKAPTPTPMNMKP